MEAGREPAGAQGAHAMASAEAVMSFYCHTCSARLELPAPSSPFHFTLCPRCRRDYLDDTPAPQPLPPPPPPLCAVPWPSDPSTSSTPPPILCVSSSSSSFTTRPRTPVSPYDTEQSSSSSTDEETMSPSHDLLPPPPPPWLPLASADTWDEYFINPSDSDDDSPPQPPPPPHVSTYDSMFDMPLQRGGSQAAAAASTAANDTVFEFDTPLQLGGSQAAPPESIAALPTVTVTDAGLGCPVCTDPLPPSAPARRLPCGHLYHSDCIVRWLSQHNSCPLCRRSIPTITSATNDTASSSQSPGRRRRRSLPVPGGRRIRRICSRLLRNMEIGRDRQTSSSRDRQTNSSGDDVHV